ncbi:DUF5134 domain-containing protein [Microlunatus speluncae]|uniref:DUF5134 domain-containing protein n=1 Tax=Microlunatus speluncae TaxID=2594267 RepID=UPI0012661F2B|nr:DUF5134 domain-containing protein [Microlunatus speluncae]
MIADWTVTVIFVATALYAIIRAAARPGWVTLVSQLLHAVMAVAMIAMTWWRQPDWLGWLQLAAFALAGVWYLLPGVRDRCDRHSAITHAVMMFGMSWMVLVMIIRPAGSIATLAGVAVLVAFLAVGSRQVVALAVPVAERRVAALRPRELDRAATALMVLGMIIMTVPMLTVASA